MIPAWWEMCVVHIRIDSQHTPPLNNMFLYPQAMNESWRKEGLAKWDCLVSLCDTKLHEINHTKYVLHTHTYTHTIYNYIWCCFWSDCNWLYTELLGHDIRRSSSTPPPIPQQQNNPEFGNSRVINLCLTLSWALSYNIPYTHTHININPSSKSTPPLFLSQRWPRLSKQYRKRERERKSKQELAKFIHYSSSLILSLTPPKCRLICEKNIHIIYLRCQITIDSIKYFVKLIWSIESSFVLLL